MPPTYIDNRYVIHLAPPNAGLLRDFQSDSLSKARIAAQLMATLFAKGVILRSTGADLTEIVSATLPSTTSRANSTLYAQDAYVVPASPNGFYYKATTGGTSAGSPPTYPTVLGATVADGGVTWTCWGPTGMPSGIEG